MHRKIELLAPGGEIESIKAAIIAGADAVYCGLDKFNARNRAENIVFDDLQGILRLAHKHDCQVFLTLNIIIVESEIPTLISLLNKLINTKIDGVIVQDLGLFYLLFTYFSRLAIHASTQLTTHNTGQIFFLKRLNASRVNLSRELSLKEIEDLTLAAHENDILTEVFVHGSNCLSFSGLCYMSSVHGGNSGNRGRCSQPCRNQYVTTAVGKDFPLNLKDNSAYADLGELADAGVDSIKIEGRIKKFHYVYTVVAAWKRQLQRLYNQETLAENSSDLYKVFNRDFTRSFLQGNINKEMFIDNPRDNSAIHLAEEYGGFTAENIEKAKRELYDLKTEIITDVKEKIALLSIEKAPLSIAVSGQVNEPLKVTVQTPDSSFSLFSESNLVKTKTDQLLNSALFLKRFKAINDTEYFIQHIGLSHLHNNLFIPFKEITLIKKKIVFILNGSRETVAPVIVPRLKKQPGVKSKPVISLLISSPKDAHLCDATTADVHFQLPNSFKNKCSPLVDFFKKNKKIIPWFPSVVIGEDYEAVVEFLQQTQPKRIVTDNTGIAYTAWQLGIPWIAGPCLNSVNSFSLLCLKEQFNCSGAFISNELSSYQIQRIQKPEDFKLYYSIYHPVALMTSRHCLFHQVTGCEKNRVDATCIEQCERSASIRNLKDVPLFIKKTKGDYHSVYNAVNCLNTDIVTELPDMFFSFLVDLRDIKTDTQTGMDKLSLVKLFEKHLNGDPDATEQLKRCIQPTTNTQYRKGI